MKKITILSYNKDLELSSLSKLYLIPVEVSFGVKRAYPKDVHIRINSNGSIRNTDEPVRFHNIALTSKVSISKRWTLHSMFDGLGLEIDPSIEYPVHIIGTNKQFNNPIELENYVSNRVNKRDINTIVLKTVTEEHQMMFSRYLCGRTLMYGINKVDTGIVYSNTSLHLTEDVKRMISNAKLLSEVTKVDLGIVSFNNDMEITGLTTHILDTNLFNSNIEKVTKALHEVIAYKDADINGRSPFNHKVLV